MPPVWDEERRWLDEVGPPPRPRKGTAAWRREVARHEARHAAMQVAHGVPFHVADVDITGLRVTNVKAAGQVVTDLDALLIRAEEDRQVVVGYVASLLVGYMGTATAFPTLPDGRDLDGLWPPSWWTVWDEKVESLAARLHAFNVTHAEYEEALVLARWFTLDPAYEAAVDRVADALERQQRLTREQVLDLMVEAMGERFAQMLEESP